MSRWGRGRSAVVAHVAAAPAAGAGGATRTPPVRKSVERTTTSFRPTRQPCAHAENHDNLKRIVSALRELRPGPTIIVTLSPIPLKATFDAPSIFTADCVSKSVLRVAIHE